MNNQDLKKLALMGIISGTVAISQTQVEAASNTKTPTQNSNTETSTGGSYNSQQDDLAQSYSNRGYYYNQDQGRGNNYYYQQNTKSKRSRTNSPDNNDQQDQYNNPSDDQRYQDMDLNRYNREKIADNYSDTSTTPPSTSSTVSSPDETPPDNLHEKPSTEEKFLSKLSSQGQSQYQKMSYRGKIMAKNMAAHNCAGFNDCKGQNACQTAMNQCAGYGACKGKSSCKVTYDEAVKLSSMIEKRNNLKN